MGLGAWLRGKIDRPEPPDPDEWVSVGVVQLHEGPLCTSALEGAGIEVHALESWGGGRFPASTTLLVRARRADEAEQIVRDVRSPPQSGPDGWIEHPTV